MLLRTLPLRLKLLAAVLLLGVGIFAKREITRALHERLPASTFLVIESLEPVEGWTGAGELLVWRIRGQRHRAHEAARTVVLSCRTLDSARPLLSDVWRQIGPAQRTPERSLVPALIGYAEEEPAPRTLEGAERLDGIEVWAGPLPATPHECVFAARWTIVTAAGAEHIVEARSITPFEVGRRADTLFGPAEPDAPPLPAPPAAEIVDEAESAAADPVPPLAPAEAVTDEPPHADEAVPGGSRS